MSTKAYGSITVTDLLDTATYIYYSTTGSNTAADWHITPTANDKYIGFYSGPPVDSGQPATPANFISSLVISKYVGEDGARGGLILNITTAPTAYTTKVGNFTPAYRIAKSTVLTQSGASDIQVGDTLAYSYYHYQVGYVDSSYVYLGAAKNIRGATGDTGTSIVKVTSLYYAKADSSTPTAPTTEITRTSTAGGVWTTAIPEISTDYPYMFRCEQIQYDSTSVGTNGFAWTTPVIDKFIESYNSFVVGDTSWKSEYSAQLQTKADQKSATKEVVQLWYSKATGVQTATGDLVSFNSPIVKPIKNLKVEINVIQEGSGDPSPENIRPISGWDAVEVTRTGANLYNANTLIATTYASRMYAVGTYEGFSVSRTQTGFGITRTNTTSYGFRCLIGYFRAGDTFYVSFNGNIPNGYSLSRTDTNVLPTTQDSGLTYDTIATDLSNKIMHTVETDGYYWLGVYETTSLVWTFDNVMLMENVTTYPISLGQTVYGGTLDVTTGELTVDKYLLTLSDTISPIVTGLGYTYVGPYWRIIVGADAYATWRIDGDKLSESICNMLEYNGGGLSTLTAGQFRISAVQTNNSRYIQFILPNQPTTVEDMQAYLASNPLTFVLPLETPQTLTLTATEVRTLLGENNIWADSGSVQVTYYDNTIYPETPASPVTTTSDQPETWTKTVPSYNSDFPNYFYCYQYLFADDSYGWSDVVLNGLPTESIVLMDKKYSSLEQTVDGFKAEVSSVYQTKDAMNEYITTEQMNSAIEQTANSITTTVQEVRETVSSTNINLQELASQQEIALQNLGEQLSGMISDLNTIVEKNSTAIEQTGTAIELLASKETIDNLTETVNSLSSELKITADSIAGYLGNDGQITAWFKFTDGQIIIGKADNPVKSIQDNASYKYVDDAGNTLLLINTDGVTADTFNTSTQIKFMNGDVNQWAIRKGNFISGVGTNFDIVWIGG